MVAKALVDTGAILAMLDENDRWHTSCKEEFRRFRLPLVTSEAVLTEYFTWRGAITAACRQCEHSSAPGL